MPRVPKWFEKYLQTSETSFNLVVLTAIITGITSFGLPTPPKEIEDFFNNYPWFKWIMLWLLIYQGGSGQNLIVTNMAFSIMFIVYNVDWNMTKNQFKKYKAYLVMLLPIVYYMYSKIDLFI